VQSLSSLWKEEPFRGLTILEPRELAYYEIDFTRLNAALKALYQIMGVNV
jgi:hypothetical protein